MDPLQRILGKHQGPLSLVFSSHGDLGWYLFNSQFLERSRDRCCNRKRTDTSRVGSSCGDLPPGWGPGRGSRRSPWCSPFPAQRKERDRGRHPNTQKNWNRVLKKAEEAWAFSKMLLRRCWRSTFFLKLLCWFGTTTWSKSYQNETF